MRLPDAEAVIKLFMLLSISQSFLTLAQSYDEQNTGIKLRHLREKKRGIRQINMDSYRSQDFIGERNCTEEESIQKGCLAGRCIAKVQSSFHLFIICSCPSDKRGTRCEEASIDLRVMSEELQKVELDILCEQERYDILASLAKSDSKAYNDCIEKNSHNDSVDKDLKRQKKERKRKEREREKKRKKKLRKQKKKDEQKKLSDNIIIDDQNDEINPINSGNSSEVLENNSQELIEQTKKERTTPKNKIRHRNDKIRIKRHLHRNIIISSILENTLESNNL